MRTTLYFQLDVSSRVGGTCTVSKVMDNNIWYATAKVEYDDGVALIVAPGGFEEILEIDWDFNELAKAAAVVAAKCYEAVCFNVCIPHIAAEVRANLYDLVNGRTDELIICAE